MWKPGNLVTIKGIVYRVKREREPFTSCRQCAFSDEFGCSLTVTSYGRYPLPTDCYLERESPVIRIVR